MRMRMRKDQIDDIREYLDELISEYEAMKNE